MKNRSEDTCSRTGDNCTPCSAKRHFEKWKASRLLILRRQPAATANGLFCALTRNSRSTSQHERALFVMLLSELCREAVRMLTAASLAMNDDFAAVRIATDQLANPPSRSR